MKNLLNKICDQDLYQRAPLLSDSDPEDEAGGTHTGTPHTSGGNNNNKDRAAPHKIPISSPTSTRNILLMHGQQEYPSAMTTHVVHWRNNAYVDTDLKKIFFYALKLLKSPFLNKYVEHNCTISFFCHLRFGLVFNVNTDP